jgi:hypothetical protein
MEFEPTVFRRGFVRFTGVPMHATLKSLAFVILIGSVLTGCGGDRVAGPSANPAKDALADLGEFLKQTANEKKKPPSKLSEMDAIEPMIPNASVAIRMGTIVYLWGATYNADGTKIVAHEKKTPTEGGLVLLENGTIQEQSAAEFAAAPKAKK